MNKKIIILVFLALILTSCKKEEVEEILLYPAYEKIDNQEKWGYINTKGDFIISPKYDMASDFVDSLAVVEKDKLFGVINKTGLEVLKPEFTSIGSIKNGYFTAERNKKLGLYGETGPVELKENYLSIGENGDGLFVIAKKDGKTSKFGYIDESGREKIKPKYDLAYMFNSGRALVKEKDIFKIINENGRVVKSLDYNDVKPIENKDLYMVSHDGEKYGLINGDGKIILEESYSWIFDVDEEQVVCSKMVNGRDRKGLVNFDGDKKLDFIYLDIKLLGDGYVAASNNKGKLQELEYTILNPSMKKINKEKYYNVEKLNQDRISVSNGSYTYLINLDGKEDLKFDKIKGFGRIDFVGEVTRVFIDDGFIYYNGEDEIIWEENTRFKINNNIEIVEKSLNDLDNISIKYPRIIGLDSKELQDNINTYLFNSFILDKNEKKFKGEDYNKLNIKYNVISNKNLLTVEKITESIGADNLKSFEKNMYNINIENGKIYRLEDIVLKERYEELRNYVNSITEFEILNYIKEFKLVDDKLYLVVGVKNNDNYISYREVVLNKEEVKDFLDYNSEYFNIIK